MNKSDSLVRRNKATARDVAVKAGVSKWTVNRAFTEGAPISVDTREKVLKAADELGYRPNLLARSLSKKRTNIIGIVVDQLNNPHIAPVLDEITTQLQNRGFMSLLLNISEESSYKSVLQLADQLQVDGLLFTGTVLSDDILTLAKNDHDINLVQMFRNSVNSEIQIVTTNGYMGGQELGRLLFSQGYTRFGYMQGPGNYSWELLRLDGYRDFLSSQEVELHTMLHADQFDYASSYRSMKEYLQNTDPKDYIDALFCENDILAMASMDALKDFGQGHHIGIVGFDGINLSEATSYNLTTYLQPVSDIIDKSIARLLNPDWNKNKELLPGKLICRTSHLRRG
ncbi:LacI family DNA-binding transcriptional regulator [Vibrio viridaestus]|uniref:LacI family transcriptional regulator n=1 Tax=Vibrio viridaestus TaxID=2487322 RepID=A0A3N9U3P8_9VIBR|nr:LacI family DNA-binding transcriptional regulator [Vibrio viridaestus]RQW64202.1 LacI family transcriptional regulator [Vibrio viridaestus]